ncbi:bifunctional 3'-5' exonuclease/DNA polymerase [Ornithinimicrobium sp. Arc0846-15]|nr:bifunctional 3'-5' exonuclease/DNA polymerase [Ornithinimicrobium laminariae]
MYAVLSATRDGASVQLMGRDLQPVGPPDVTDRDGLPSLVHSLNDRRTADSPTSLRWVWADTTRWYPSLLAAGLRIERCHDLRLTRRIIRGSSLTADSHLAGRGEDHWDRATPASPPAAAPEALFDAPDDTFGGLAFADVDVLGEFAAQQDAISGSPSPRRLSMLVAAESAGALIAAEMSHAGLPWSAQLHDAVLTEALGPRPRLGDRPAILEDVRIEVAQALGNPSLNPDSATSLLRALREAGLDVESTRSWELQRIEHPAIEPLLRYKKLSRLMTANGWAWCDAWVRDGRFRPDYVVGGVVTGRWATSGGGALQIPHQIRRAVVADPGWTFVVADAAQVEPRVLAGMARDEAMAAAGQGGDLYSGIVATSALSTREEAKLALLGAMYGATTGASADLMPHLRRAFPTAIEYVAAAAAAGERRESVMTWWGRTSPQPGAWPTQESAARTAGRSWGRFTRNFVVQGSAAEWAMSWMAILRGQLSTLTLADRPDAGAIAPGAAPAPFGNHPHLVFFVHDEIVVHTPIECAGEVADLVRDAATAAGHLMFGDFAVDFPLSVAVVDCYADGK